MKKSELHLLGERLRLAGIKASEALLQFGQAVRKINKQHEEIRKSNRKNWKK